MGADRLRVFHLRGLGRNSNEKREIKINLKKPCSLDTYCMLLINHVKKVPILNLYQTMTN